MCEDCPCTAMLQMLGVRSHPDIGIHGRATLATTDQCHLCCQVGVLDPKGAEMSSGRRGTAIQERMLPGFGDGTAHGRMAGGNRRALLANTPTQSAGPGLRAAIYAGQYGTLPIPSSWQVGVRRRHLHINAIT